MEAGAAQVKARLSAEHDADAVALEAGPAWAGFSRLFFGFEKVKITEWNRQRRQFFYV